MLSTGGAIGRRCAEVPGLALLHAVLRRELRGACCRAARAGPACERAAGSRTNRQRGWSRSAQPLGLRYQVNSPSRSGDEVDLAGRVVAHRECSQMPAARPRRHPDDGMPQTSPAALGAHNGWRSGEVTRQVLTGQQLACGLMSLRRRQ